VYFFGPCVSRVVSGTEQKNSSFPFTKGLTALTTEIDCDETALGLPHYMSAVFLIAKSLVKYGFLGGISEMCRCAYYLSGLQYFS
jgi:hypothetical protein